MVDRQEEEALVQEVTWFRGVSGEEGKVEKIKTDGRKEKIQINTIMHIEGKMGRPQGNPI